MSQKKSLLANAESFDLKSSFRTFRSSRARFKSILLESGRPRGSRPRLQEVRVVKMKKENVVSYEEFLDILHKPSVFIIKWNSTVRCCNRPQKYSDFEITNLSGCTLLQGKLSEESSSVRVFDNRNRLFMILDYTDKDTEAILSVPNSSIPLATLKKLPLLLPYNHRFQMHSDHFPELNYNIEHQTMPSRYTGSLFKYTVTSGRRMVSKLLQPSRGGQMYILVDENVSVFQKSGILAASIFISQRPIKSFGKFLWISIIFLVVFTLGFFIVGSTVFDLRYKNPDFEGPKFPHKLKTEDGQ